MFFVLSKILSFFCFPLSLSLLLLLMFGVIRRRPRERGEQRGRGQGRAWALFWLGLLLLWSCSAAPVADLLMQPLEGPYKNRSLPAKVEAIVVLGGFTDLSLSNEQHLELSESADRFFAALELAKRYPSAVLIFSGGTGSLFDQTTREAPYVKAAALRCGVSAERVLTDSESRNTYENAVETKKLLERRGAWSVVLVTSGFHMRRALGCFHKVGLRPSPYAVDFRAHGGHLNPLNWVPDASSLGQSTAAIREYIGLLMYRVKGYL